MHRNTAFQQLKAYLDEKVMVYNHPGFIADDPISIPHRFTRVADIEIAGFFAATLAWGNRRSIISSCNRLLALMGQQPYEFCLHHSTADLKSLLGFVHRTFNGSDLLAIVHFFQRHYRQYDSLETAFSQWMPPSARDTEAALAGFHQYVFSDLRYFEARTRKHISTPDKKSACKRLNMYLRWMVRPATTGVDFGIWKTLSPAQLVCPLDVHVARVARQLGLLQRTQNDWQAALELTDNLRSFDADDPVKYDFALFGLGVMEKGGTFLT
jgi:uncharacterized protein (TIGR02757 family)